ncbi:TRAP transporter substrate-binding protein [Arsenicitalea aurantiaca]|nr:TRAP transporter substrate-binding protein [Arsenicitalea aurantiaca]
MKFWTKLVVAACVGGTLAGPALAQSVTIQLASAFNADTDMMQAAERFGELVSERSGGEIAVRYFPGGQMGGERDNLEALKIGEIEMAVFGTYPIVSLAPAYSFFDAPFVFRDRDHVYATWQSELGDEVREIFEAEHGVRALGMMGRGYRHLTSNDPINSVEDMEGMRIRMGQSKPFIEAFTETGAVVVPIALPELFTSLRLGTVSASDGPFDQIYTFNLHEAQSHLALTGHLYATSLWMMNEDFYAGLSDAHREIIDTAASEALAYGDELALASEERLRGVLVEAGMQITEPDYAGFMEKVRPAIDRLFAEDWSVTTAEEIAAIQ